MKNFVYYEIIKRINEYKDVCSFLYAFPKVFIREDDKKPLYIVYYLNQLFQELKTKFTRCVKSRLTIFNYIGAHKHGYFKKISDYFRHMDIEISGYYKLGVIQNANIMIKNKTTGHKLLNFKYNRATPDTLISYRLTNYNLGCFNYSITIVNFIQSHKVNPKLYFFEHIRDQVIDFYLNFKTDFSHVNVFEIELVAIKWPHGLVDEIHL